MASNLDFVKFVCEQMSDAGFIEYKKLFGEYSVYCNNKIIALICNNQLFIKITDKCRNLLNEIIEAPAYPGSKPFFLIESVDNKDYMSRIARTTYEELPEKFKK